MNFVNNFMTAKIMITSFGHSLVKRTFGEPSREICILIQMRRIQAVRPLFELVMTHSVFFNPDAYSNDVHAYMQKRTFGLCDCVQRKGPASRHNASVAYLGDCSPQHDGHIADIWRPSLAGGQLTVWNI